MVENHKKQPEVHIRLRYAEAEHLLKALELLPENDKVSVTHLDLKRQLTIIRDYWLKKERDRKAAQKILISRKSQKN